MPIYRLLGRVSSAAAVRIDAANENQALIRASFGEFDSVDVLGSQRFEMDFASDPQLLPEHLKPRRYRVIFSETTQYAVEFSSSLPPSELAENEAWRDELDRYATARKIPWHGESAVGVESTTLEHLEEIPAMSENPTPADAFRITVVATGICTCNHPKRLHLIPDGACIQCPCKGFRDKGPAQ